jgi:hypothetical protein
LTFRTLHGVISQNIVLFLSDYTDIVGNVGLFVLAVLEHRTLRRAFGPNWDKIRGGWRKLHNEELHNRIVKSRRMRWTGHVACMGAKRSACRIWVIKPEGNRPLGIPRRR